MFYKNSIKTIQTQKMRIKKMSDSPTKYNPLHASHLNETDVNKPRGSSSKENTFLGNTLSAGSKVPFVLHMLPAPQTFR